jgi:hypothetical protein
MSEFYPYVIATQFLNYIGLDIASIYNDRGGIQRQQLKVLNSMDSLSKIKSNAYQTIHRLEKSKNKSSLDFTKNLQNVVGGTATAGVMATLDALPHHTKKDIMIKWLPSSADEHDIVHGLNYGETMSLETALHKKLGTRYGCKCGFEVVKGNEEVSKQLGKIPQKKRGNNEI